MTTSALSPEVVQQVSERLGRYVYLLVDPRDSRPFYVGKGRGVRMLAHGLEAVEAGGEDRPKLARILDIRAAGLEHEIWIARYGLTEAEYTAVEAALIDVLGSFPIRAAASDAPYRPLERRSELTNLRREDAHDKGLILLDRLVDELAAPELSTTEPLVLITLGAWTEEPEPVAGGRTRSGHGFKREWIDPAIRDRDLAVVELSTSSWWTMRPDELERRGIRHAVARFNGVTRALFEIDASTWQQRMDGRWAFVGRGVTGGALWDEVVGLHGHRVPGERGSQNPILYWPRIQKSAVNAFA